MTVLSASCHRKVGLRHYSDDIIRLVVIISEEMKREKELSELICLSSVASAKTSLMETIAKDSSQPCRQRASDILPHPSWRQTIQLHVKRSLERKG